MHSELLEVLRCPRTGAHLRLEEPVLRGERVFSGWLRSESGEHRYPIRDYIPRFVPESNYADNFGLQWNRFRQTQLDSHSGSPISAERFWKATGWSPRDLQGQWILDAGCGAGRFAEIALQAGGKVVALDYSSAVDACYANLGPNPALHVVQGDVYSLPLAKERFAFVYSLGVLQHTPDVARAFAALPPMLIKGGSLCTDFYWKRLRTMLHTKYLLRPFTTKVPQQQLFETLQRWVPRMLPVSQFLRRIPLLGRILQRFIPVADYTGILPLSPERLKEWALLDTFDMLAPRYDSPQTSATVHNWMRQAGMVDIEVFHGGHLVGRSRKPS